jgi:hypothetical protein
VEALTLACLEQQKEHYELLEDYMCV